MINQKSKIKSQKYNSKVKSIREFYSARERRGEIEKLLKVKLPNIADFSFSEEEVKNKNIENLIGRSQIPLGVAGPLKIIGKYAKGDFFLPLTTTEGALVASVSRGAKAVSDSGGAKVYVENIGVTRGPVFLIRNLEQGFVFKNWLIDNFIKLAEAAENTSSHLKLLKQEVEIVGKQAYVRFYFDTQDAMGMNMVTIATESITRLIKKETGIDCLSLAGNYDIDKKPSWLNFIRGRGKKVWAEAVINSVTVSRVLKTTPQKIHDVAINKCFLGSIMSGSMGFNSHFANIIAAIFAATGQDLAHVTEGSLGVTTTDIIDNSLYISVYLPDLMIGTVGGGTNLPSQKECLSILGIPDNKLKEGQQVLKLGEIIGSAVLAGELSLLAALANNDLVKAHERLGRGRK